MCIRLIRLKMNKLNYLIRLYLRYEASFQKASRNWKFYRFLKYESFLDLKHLFYNILCLEINYLSI